MQISEISTAKLREFKQLKSKFCDHYGQRYQTAVASGQQNCFPKCHTASDDWPLNPLIHMQGVCSFCLNTTGASRLLKFSYLFRTARDSDVKYYLNYLTLILIDFNFYSFSHEFLTKGSQKPFRNNRFKSITFKRRFFGSKLICINSKA